MNLNVNICGINFKNPIIAASGTYGFGKEYENFYDISELGGISVKGLTPEQRQGNPPPRIAETSMGILNSVGLQNPGVDAFLDNEWPRLKEKNLITIANIAGKTINDYCYMAERIGNAGIPMIEMNISCPNVKQGGMAFGASPESVYEITKQVRKHCNTVLIVKLSPNTADIAANAKAAEYAGADAVSLINTITGMAINAKTRKPVLGNVIGGLSGPAVKPVALRMVYQAARAIKIPVIGMGGIMTGEDVAEFMIAGASAVMIGTANVYDPNAAIRIIGELKTFMQNNAIDDVNELIGSIRVV